MTIIALTACSGKSNTEQATPTPIPTPVIPTKPTYQVQRGDIEQVLEFTGRVVPVTEQELFFGVGGRVDEVFVQQGEKVQAGQLLAVLETGNREFDLKRAQINLEMAQLRLQMEIINTPKYSKTYTYTIALQEKEVELQKLALAELEKAVADSRIISPIDGTIRSLTIRDGDVVEAFKPVMVIADVQNLEVNADLGGDNLAKLQEGMPVTLSPVVLEGEILEGVIRQLPYPYGSGSKGSPDQTVRISTKGTLHEKGYDLGDLVEVLAILEKRENILWLPPQAIRTFEGRRFVVVKDDQGQRRVDVRLGLQSEDRVEILEGLEEGQIVLAP
jgi:RND family efflux transporter MFP subunit